MNIRIFSFVAIALAASAAHATAFAPTNGQCPNGYTKGGNGMCYQVSSPTTTGTSGTAGGSGGAGGAGGSATASGGAGGAGGSSLSLQGQQQGQVATGGTATGGKSSVSGSGNSTNLVGSSSVSTGGAVMGSGNSTIASGAVQNHTTVSTGGNTQATVAGNGNGAHVTTGATSVATGPVTVNPSQTGSVTGTQSVNAGTAGSGNSTTTTNVENVHYNQPPATAYAAPLVASPGTCLGSLSGGAQAPMFGLSVGGTKQDKTCAAIMESNAIKGMGAGMDVAACERLMALKDVREAFKRAHKTCADLSAPPAASDVVTHAELNDLKRTEDERVDRAFKRTLEK